MVDRFRVHYHYNAGVSIACNNNLYIFNYWQGEEETLPTQASIQDADFTNYQNVFVFVCNDRSDILDPIIYTWQKHANVQYICSADASLHTQCIALKPQQYHVLCEGVVVQAHESTDKGICFSLSIDNLNIFNAGTFNLWHWMEISNLDEINNAQISFENILSQLPKNDITLAIFPLDVRQGLHYEAGAVQYISRTKPRFFMPVRYLNRGDIVNTFARDYTNLHTTVLPFIKPGSFADFYLENEKWHMSGIQLKNADD
ncbi:MAG: hypothetical protein SPL05_02475 [Eubacteriales bacterium]|nr:hypothetical protein [Eubacteriales bacterium]